MLKVMKYAVIGSGPCGSLAAFLLLRAGHEVWLYDVNSNESLNPVNLISKLKLMGDSSAPYDIQQKLRVVHNQRPINIYRSKQSGGYSNVWGATWGAQKSLSYGSWPKHHEVVTSILRSDGYFRESPNLICDCLEFLNRQILRSDLPSKVSIEKSSLALNPLVCECVIDGLSSCFHGGVWNSKSLLSKCESFEKFNFNSGFDVIRIEKSDSGVNIIGNDFSEECETAILAAGSLGSIEILLNSLIDVESLSLQDTRMAFLPLFKLGIRKPHDGGFAFSQFNLNANFGSKDFAVHIQLYSDSEIYVDRIIGKLPILLSFLITPFLNLILRNISIAIVYVDAALSPQLLFSQSKQDREICVDYKKPRFTCRGLKIYLWRIFRELKFVPLLPLLSWSNPGESYHLGALGDGLLDEVGSVRDIPGLYVAGAMALPRIEPGPITHSAMAQTSRLIEYLTTKI